MGNIIGSSADYASSFNKEELREMLLDVMECDIPEEYLARMAKFNLLDSMNAKGLTLLVSAIRRGSFKFANSVLDKGATVAFNQGINSNAIAAILKYDGSDKYFADCRTFFQRLLDTYVEQKYGKNASDEMIADDELLKAALIETVSQKIPEFYTSLICKGADSHFAFEHFLLKGDQNTCRFLIENDQVDVNHVFSNGETFLMRVVEQIDIFSEEIENAQASELKFTKKIIRAKSTHFNLCQCLDLLLLAEADISIMNSQDGNKVAADYTSLPEIKDRVSEDDICPSSSTSKPVRVEIPSEEKVGDTQRLCGGVSI